MIGLLYGEEITTRVKQTPESDRQTDGQTDRIAISIMLTRDKSQTSKMLTT